MEKIESLLIRKTRLNPKAKWIFTEGEATVQYDGVAYAILDNHPYIHTVTATPSKDFRHCSFYEGQCWGWEPVPADDPVFHPMWEEVYQCYHWNNWSYELVDNALIAHGKELIHALRPPRTFEQIRTWLKEHKTVEGIVFWQDTWDLACQKIKIQRTDFKRGEL